VNILLLSNSAPEIKSKKEGVNHVIVYALREENLALEKLVNIKHLLCQVFFPTSIVVNNSLN